MNWRRPATADFIEGPQKRPGKLFLQYPRACALCRNEGGFLSAKIKKKKQKASAFFFMKIYHQRTGPGRSSELRAFFFAACHMYLQAQKPKGRPKERTRIS
jgi:hypothetical protein